MLTFLRKKTKTIMIVIVVMFGFSMFYGIGYQGVRSLSGSKTGFVKVNGKEVDMQRYKQIYSRLRENFPEYMKPQESLFLENLALSQTIDFTLMLGEARKQVNVSGSDINSALEDIAKNQKFSSVQDFKNTAERNGLKWDDVKRLVRDDLLVSRMMGKVRSEASVSSNDLREIKASHILVKNEKLAQTLADRAKHGEDFASLAKKYSEDPGSKSKGGDLGYFGSGAMVKPFEDAAFSAKIDDIVGPVKTDYGFHIIKVEDARIKKVAGGKDANKAILEEKQEKAYQNWFYEIKKSAKIEIENPAFNALDLRFKGRFADSLLEYKKAIQENPRDAYLHVFLGSLYEEMKKPELSVGEYKQAVDISSGDPSLHLLLGQAYAKANKDDLAVGEFKKASMIAGDRKEIHLEIQKAAKENGLGQIVKMEKEELARIAKKEAFEKSLQDKTKVKVD